jgi:hypothetical protein
MFSPFNVYTTKNGGFRSAELVDGGVLLYFFFKGPMRKWCEMMKYFGRLTSERASQRSARAPCSTLCKFWLRKGNGMDTIWTRDKGHDITKIGAW